MPWFRLYVEEEEDPDVMFPDWTLFVRPVPCVFADAVFHSVKVS